MTQEELREHLDQIARQLSDESAQVLKGRLASLRSAYPFNEFEYILMYLRECDAITFADYEELRFKYVESNKNLNLFGLAPRIFGQVWGEQHILDIDSRFQKPSKEIDPTCNGQYDLYADGVRIEVKAARAIDTKRRGDLVSKALRRNSDRPFWMNFQQLKTDECDVFVFIGVWIDVIAYWVLSSAHVKSSPYLSHQHRGGVEYQIGVNERNVSLFDQFYCPAENLYSFVVSKGRS